MVRAGGLRLPVGGGDAGFLRGLLKRAFHDAGVAPGRAAARPPAAAMGDRAADRPGRRAAGPPVRMHSRDTDQFGDGQWGGPGRVFALFGGYAVLVYLAAGALAAWRMDNFLRQHGLRKQDWVAAE